MANRTSSNSTNDTNNNPHTPAPTAGDSTTNDINNNPHTPTPTAGSRHPIYHGIRCRLKTGKWVSEIRVPHSSTRIWLGTYPTPEMAAAAYDAAALALKGSHALLNFPDSVLPDTLPECPTADDICAVAARAAAARNPSNKEETGSSTRGEFMPNKEETGSSTRGGFIDHDAVFNMPNKEETGSSTRGEFMDHDAVFDMPNMLSDMAEGMLLSPPRMNSIPPQDQYEDSSSGWNNLWDY
ncbi:putative transcription factor AP2-EREBP family [Helianthus annuus]|uniref:Transcription factor AP2-EREBP family n=1 Tax=Helianthus annuus TaxID=4232 RepID=A0A9K3IDU6_HELAN|nr:ethylene-responsive transcription factor ERF027-like [Helianthus annuus]KAF5795101.1 putative transcription factor AP2-EREBP family [Helianthus annuus]KAJ0546577.1 putative transcription factor AP2-EREBP family [Helianthus annuus]KAJ0553279.1 putative transcription factor AP2-EREBP family [Helianthus annuus]KAJ0718941.1 putative transcription factor AP2-EREBP family [Helianthus annuus]KAJ0722191.1 putative transcription factor AP2-EREBP family [Helianthus annuus]